VTYRMKGHAEHDAQHYVPREELEDWKRRDPIERYIRVLVEPGEATMEDLSAIDAAVARDLDRDVELALASPFPAPGEALSNVYGPAGQGVAPAVVRSRR